MPLFPDTGRPESDSTPRRAAQSRGSAGGAAPEALVNPSSEFGLGFLSGGGILSATAKLVMESVGANGIAIAYAMDGAVVCRASYGENAPPVGTPVNLNSGIGAQCLREGKTVICADTESDPRVNTAVCRQIGVRSILAVPLRRGSKVVGVAQVFYAEPNGFSDASLAELESSADLFVSCLPAGNGAEGNVPSSPAGRKDLVANDAATHSTSGEQGHSSFAKLSLDKPDAALDGPKAWPATVAGQTAPTFFAQIEEPVWWKRPTLVAVALSVILALLWIVLHESSRNLISAKGNESQNAVGEAQVDRNGSTSQLSFVQLLKRARSGDTQAQVTLAQRYEKDSGVGKNLTKAYSWYMVAAEAGNDSAKPAIQSLTSKLTAAQLAAARFEVGRMYANGIGARRDRVTAYAWLILAEAAGERRAKAQQKALARSMRAVEILQARSRAAGWLTARDYRTELAKAAPTSAQR